MTAALMLLKAHWAKLAVVLLIAGAYGAGRVHQGWKEGAAREEAVQAALRAKEEEAKANRRKSAALRGKLAAKDRKIRELQKEIRHALDRPDDIIYGPRALCLRARARGYPCRSPGSVPGQVSAAPSGPIRGGKDEAVPPDGGRRYGR